MTIEFDPLETQHPTSTPPSGAMHSRNFAKVSLLRPPSWWQETPQHDTGRRKLDALLHGEWRNWMAARWLQSTDSAFDPRSIG